MYPASMGAGWWPESGDFESSTIIASPAYEPNANNAAQDDIGIVRLSRPIPSAVVATLDLTGALWSALPDGSPLLSAGHGLTCNGGAECVSRTLMVASVPKVNTARCEADTSDAWPSDIVGEALCAGFIGVDNAPQPCQVRSFRTIIPNSTKISHITDYVRMQGDSGGPLFDPSGVVYALVSRGDASLGCGNSMRPTLFAPVSRAVKFLMAEVFSPPPALGSRDANLGPLVVTVGGASDPSPPTAPPHGLNLSPPLGITSPPPMETGNARSFGIIQNATVPSSGASLPARISVTVLTFIAIWSCVL